MEDKSIEGYDFESVNFLDPKGKTGYPNRKKFSTYDEYLKVIETFEEKYKSEINELWRTFIDSQKDEINGKIKYLEFLNNESRHVIVHPVLTILENLLFICFSERKLNVNYKAELLKAKLSKKQIAPEKWHQIITCIISEILEGGTNKISIENKDEVIVGSIKYYLEPDSSSKSRRLPNMSDRWNKQMIYDVVANCKVDKKILYENIIIKAKKHLKFEYEEDYHLLVSWTLATYFHPIFNAFPYLHFKAMKGSGKTTALSFIGSLAFNASKEAATFPAMRDKIDTFKATFIVDQADTKLGNRQHEDSSILDVFVDSYKKSKSKFPKWSWLEKIMNQ